MPADVTQNWVLRYFGCSLAVAMQSEMGSTPALGVASRRPRRVAGPRAESLSSEFVRGAENVTGEGASHDARGGRAPPLPCYGSGLLNCRQHALRCHGQLEQACAGSVVDGVGDHCAH